MAKVAAELMRRSVNTLTYAEYIRVLTLLIEGLFGIRERPDAPRRLSRHDASERHYLHTNRRGVLSRDTDSRNRGSNGPKPDDPQRRDVWSE